MAVGDIVSARSAAAFSFRPAAGIEIMLLSASSANNTWLHLIDAAGTSNFAFFANVNDLANIRVGLTNALWLDLNGGSENSYTGIQIK